MHKTLSCPNSRVGRHNHMSLGANRILRLPQASHGLLLRVELQPRLSVEGVGATTSNTLLVTGEREHGQRDGDGHVNANLAGFDVLLEPRGRGARAGEDGGAVAVFVGVDQVDGVVERVHVQADEDRAEDFFPVAAHFGGDVGDDSRANLGSSPY